MIPENNNNVAGGRIERPSQGYEPCEMPLLYPAKLKIDTLNYKPK